jgi:hypothetical protein
MHSELGAAVDYPTEYNELVELIVSENLENEQLLTLLKQHTHWSTDCDVCEEILELEPEGAGCLFDLIFESNIHSLSSEILDYMIANLTSTIEYGEWAAGLLAKFAKHPKSSKETLTSGSYEWGYNLWSRWKEGDSFSIAGIEQPLADVASSHNERWRSV